MIKKQIVFIHRLKTPNTGDLVSSPFLYSRLSGATVKRFDISECEPNSKVEFYLDRADVIIVGGGGLLFRKYLHALSYLVDSYSSKLVLWGVGVNTPGYELDRDILSVIESISFVGLRDRDVVSSFFHDNTCVHYVPCASCLSLEVIMGSQIKAYHSTSSDSISHSSVLIASNNAGASSCPLEARVDIIRANFSCERIVHCGNRKVGLASAIRFILFSKLVITSSYHYAYWAMLLGRPVIAIGSSFKFFSLHNESQYRSNLFFQHINKEDLLESISAALNYIQGSSICSGNSDSFLVDSLKRNLIFASDARIQIPALQNLVLNAEPMLNCFVDSKASLIKVQGEV